MNEFMALKLLDRVSPLLTRAGADYGKLRLLLQVKLTLDSRRTPTVLSSTDRGSGKEKSPLGVQWLYVFLGFMVVSFVVSDGPGYMLQMSLLFGMLMFLVMTSLISDFSSVMLDLKDKSILFSKPIDRTTLNMAKSIHILIYLTILTLSVAGPSLLFSLFRRGPVFFALYAAELVLMDAFILVMTSLIYLLILKFFDGERLKDMIAYVQIMLSIAITIGYQLISRLFNMNMPGAGFEASWWHLAAPPIWFAAPFEAILGSGGGSRLIILALMALLVPLSLVLAYIRLMPVFERSLQKLAEQGAAARERSGLAGMLSRLVCRDRTEALFFRFAWSMMKNEREFKLKVYPSIGFSLVFPFLFLFNSMNGREWGLGAFSGSRTYLFIYMTGMLMPTIVQMLRYSSHYKGAWIYGTAPLQRPGMVGRGALKAVLLRLVLPLCLFSSAAFLLLYGPGILVDLAAVLLAMPLYAVISFRMFPKSLPFSRKFESTRGYTRANILLLLILGGFLLVHLAASMTGFGLYLYLALLAAANVLLWRPKAFEGVILEE